jgi:hypothetical protein
MRGTGSTLVLLCLVGCVTANDPSGGTVAFPGLNVALPRGGSINIPSGQQPQAPYNAYQQPYQRPYQQPYQQPYAQPYAQQTLPQHQNSQPTEGEQQMRAALLQRSMGFGGIFGPTLKNWMNTPEGNSPGHGQCSDYSDYAACQAHKNGDDWAADRLRNNQSSGAERDWYNR